MGVDVGDRDGRPRAQASPAGRGLGQPAGDRTEAVDVARHLVVDDRGQAGLEAAEERGVRKAVALRPLGLVARGAGVARLRPGELPDDPVGGLDQPVRGTVDPWRLVEDLEALGVEPLRRDPAPVSRQPRLAAGCGQRVDAVRLGLRGVVLPELDPGVRFATELGHLAQRRAVGRGREHRARGEVDADADDVSGVDPGGRQQLSDGRPDRRDIVGRVLERPIGLEDDVVVWSRQPAVDDAVGVRVDGRRQLRAGRHVDHHRAPGLGPEVDADGDRHRAPSPSSSSRPPPGVAPPGCP